MVDASESGRVLILDELVARPGQAAACRTAYHSLYVAAAKRRGMRLDGAWQTPAARDYDELPTTLYWLWSVADVRAWWAMRFSRNVQGGDGRFEKLAFWQQIQPLLVSRKRRVLAAQSED